MSADASSPPATWLILGASSSMARAFGRAAAAEGASVILAGRDQEDLGRSAQDLTARHGVMALAVPFDATDTASHAAFAADIAERCPGLVHVFLAFGAMPPQEAIETDPGLAADTIAASYSGAVSILLHLAPVLESRGDGLVIVIGSVAGDRGRLKNYVYGSAKAGLHTFTQGLRNRLGRSGVHVMTVKPGFVDTAMTWGQPGLFLVASPDQVAEHCLRAARKGRDEIYTPGFWWLIMTIIKAVPETVFKKLKI